MSKGLCPFCLREAKILTSLNDRNRDIITFSCDICGDFCITEDALIEAESKIKNGLPHNDFAKVSSYLKHRTIENRYVKGNSLSPILIVSERDENIKDKRITATFEKIISYFPKTLNDQIDYMLLNLARLSNYPGDVLRLEFYEHSLYYSKSWDKREIEFIVLTAFDKGYIETNNRDGSFFIRLKSMGWERVDVINRKIEEPSNQAFIAMWFGAEMNEASDMIKAAIKDAGYDPRRVDDIQHNSKICDRIIGEIRKSKFVVCDFTNHRGGVYFEAGYALGMGLPVIWTCKESDISNAHFDTRQYNHITWKDEQELYEKLYNRIRATI